MSEPLRVFGFGSLIFAPESPERCIQRISGVAHGLRRSFNKRSRARSCPVKLSYDAFPDVSTQFRRDNINFSLALGTEESDDHGIEGVIFEYAAHGSSEVLAHLDAREGYEEGRDDVENGYLRKRVPIETASGSLEVWMYLSNPDPQCMYFVDPLMADDEKARILINATPIAGENLPGSARVRGLYYLEGVRAGLRKMGVIDGGMERIAAAVLGYSGPWCRIIHPPQPE